jgi:hypothetical protein
VNPVTLRNLPPEVARIVRKRAHERRTSVNKAVIELLQEGLGLAGKTPRLLHHDLDDLAGSWTKRESEAFDEALDSQRAIDPDVWK